MDTQGLQVMQDLLNPTVGQVCRQKILAINVRCFSARISQKGDAAAEAFSKRCNCMGGAGFIKKGHCQDVMQLRANQKLSVQDVPE
eukprot:1134766-Pelagomonas_calceolata.AAC.1